MRITVRTEPGWAVVVQGLDSALRVAGSSVMNAAARRLQGRLRREVRAAGLGVGLEKAIRANVFPNRRKSYRASALVFSRATRLHEAFQADRVIVGQRGLLALPTAEAKRRGFDRDPRKGGGGGAAQPRKWSNIEAAERAVGRLHARPIGRGRYLLVDHEGTAFFVLVPVARLKGRLDWDAAGKAEQARLPAALEAALARAGNRAQTLLRVAGDALPGGPL